LAEIFNLLFIKILGMTPRSFFNIVIKILGLYFLKNIIETIPQFISTASLMAASDSTEDAAYIFIGTSVILSFYIFTSFVLLGRTNKIVNMLRLDQGFDQNDFSLEISNTSILTIALILIGGLILTNEIPNLCRSLYIYVTQRNLSRFAQERPDLSYSIFIAVKIILGLLLVGERKRIVNFITSKQNKSVD